MALISATTIVRSLAMLHLITAYYFLVSPQTIATHNLVVVMSAAVGLPLPDPEVPSASLAHPSPVTALLACVLALVGVSDLAATSMLPEVSLLYFSSQAPVRLVLFFALTAWSYSFRPGGIMAGRAQSEALASENVMPPGVEGIGRGIGSGVVFSWAFVEVIGWFWAFITLRDERREAVMKEARRKGE